MRSNKRQATERLTIFDVRVIVNHTTRQIRSRILSLPIAEGERLSALRHLDSAEAVVDALEAVIAFFAGHGGAKPSQPLRPAH